MLSLTANGTPKSGGSDPSWSSIAAARTDSPWRNLEIQTRRHPGRERSRTASTTRGARAARVGRAQAETRRRRGRDPHSSIVDGLVTAKAPAVNAVLRLSAGSSGARYVREPWRFSSSRIVARSPPHTASKSRRCRPALPPRPLVGLAAHVGGHVQLQFEDHRLYTSIGADARSGHQRQVERPVRGVLGHGVAVGRGPLHRGDRGGHRVEARLVGGAGGGAADGELLQGVTQVKSSSMSRADSCVTRTPRRGRCSTSPCWPSRRSASRSGAREVPNRRVSCSSTIRSPGASSPGEISARSRRTARSTRLAASSGSAVTVPMVPGRGRQRSEGGRGRSEEEGGGGGEGGRERGEGGGGGREEEEGGEEGEEGGRARGGRGEGERVERLAEGDGGGEGGEGGRR